MTILIVDDDRGQRGLLESFLRGQGYRTQTAASGEEALRTLKGGPFALMISDVRMPGMSGIETLRRVRQEHPELPVLLVTAFADVRDAVSAMRDGAVNYLAKPIDLDELLASVHLATLPPGAPAPAREQSGDLPPDVVAESPLMRAVYRDAAVIAPTATPVLITGESGSGKEVVAELIHAWSSRSAVPLVRLNCAALTDAMTETDLLGRFREAKGGSILFDEIAELPMAVQAKLPRMMHDGQFARVIAATNRDLEAQIAAGAFREDLFYRLNVMEIHIPPLRERPEDIIPLATQFIGRFSHQKSRFSATAAACLTRYRWPGNVRELRNAMERAALLSRGTVVLPEHLPARVVSGADAQPAETAETAVKLEQIEREAILKTLRKNNYNRTETAKELAISRRALTYKLQRLRAEGAPIDPVDPAT